MEVGCQGNQPSLWELVLLAPPPGLHEGQCAWRLSAALVANDAINPALRGYVVTCLRKETALEEAYGWGSGCGCCLVSGSLEYVVVEGGWRPGHRSGGFTHPALYLCSIWLSVPGVCPRS